MPCTWLHSPTFAAVLAGWTASLFGCADGTMRTRQQEGVASARCSDWEVAADGQQARSQRGRDLQARTRRSLGGLALPRLRGGQPTAPLRLWPHTPRGAGQARRATPGPRCWAAGRTREADRGAVPRALARRRGTHHTAADDV